MLRVLHKLNPSFEGLYDGEQWEVLHSAWVTMGAINITNLFTAMVVGDREVGMQVISFYNYHRVRSNDFAKYYKLLQVYIWMIEGEH